MPNVKPVKFKSIGYNDNLVIQSGAMDFNEFNLGCISEKYCIVGVDVFSENKSQLMQSIAVNYIDANGNEKKLNKSPRIDSYQLSDAINCIDLPSITCDGLNRFEYPILPNTEALMLFKLDKRCSITQSFKQDIGTSEDQTNAVIEDLFDGYDTKDILPTQKTEQDEIKKADQIEINNENFYLKQIVNVNINNTKAYMNAAGSEKNIKQPSIFKKLLPFIVIIGICGMACMVLNSKKNEN